MASKLISAMHSRPIRPTPSRKSNFPAGTPTTVYSQSAAEFRPPPDYIGPRKSKMGRPPDPSMNPTGFRKLSYPLVSVSKLDVQVAVPPSSQTSLPRVNAKKPVKKPLVSTTFLECVEAKSILRNMPQSFRKQFHSELRKKRPFTGRQKGFIRRDFHNTAPPEPVNLHGIIFLRGSNRVLIEEVKQEPSTPPPLSGRRHCDVQTDTYLEDIADDETGFIGIATQCEPIYDEPVEAPPLDFEAENVTTTGTQLDQWVFSDIDHFFDQAATNLADCIIMESLKQLQEEFELEALRKQHEYHKCLRNREMSILAKYKAAQEKYEKQKRILESRQPWDQTLDQIIQLVGFDTIRNIAPQDFIGSQTSQAVYEHLQNTIVPPMNAEAEEKLGIKKASRNILDDIIDDSVTKREAEYAGKMYIFDPDKKGSLASESISRQSLGGEDYWTGEYEDVYQGIIDNFEIPDYSLAELAAERQDGLREYGNVETKEEQGDAWDDIGGERRHSTESSYDEDQPRDDYYDVDEEL